MTATFVNAHSFALKLHGRVLFFVFVIFRHVSKATQIRVKFSNCGVVHLLIASYNVYLLHGVQRFRFLLAPKYGGIFFLFLLPCENLVSFGEYIVPG